MIYAEPGHIEGLSDAEREAAHAEFLALAGDARVIGDVELQPVCGPRTCTGLATRRLGAGGRTVFPITALPPAARRAR